MCKLGHEWECLIADRGVGEKKKNSGCPVCARNKIVAGFNDLSTTHPDLVLQWHPVKNKRLLPTQVPPNSHRKVWWLGECTHEWTSSLASRSRSYEIDYSSGCPICNGKTVLQGFNDLASQYPDIAQQWHPILNEKAPDIVGGLNFECVDSAGSTVAVLSLDELGSGFRRVVGYGDVLSFLSSEVLVFMLSSIAGAGFVKSLEVAPFPSVMRRDKRVVLDLGAEGFSFVDVRGKFQLVKSGKLIWDAGMTCYKRTV